MCLFLIYSSLMDLGVVCYSYGYISSYWYCGQRALPGSCVQVQVFATDSIKGLSLPNALLFLGLLAFSPCHGSSWQSECTLYILKAKKITGFIVGNLAKAVANSHNSVFFAQITHFQFKVCIYSQQRVDAKLFCAISREISKANCWKWYTHYPIFTASISEPSGSFILAGKNLSSDWNTAVRSAK